MDLVKIIHFFYCQSNITTYICQTNENLEIMTKQEQKTSRLNELIIELNYLERCKYTDSKKGLTNQIKSIRTQINNLKK